MASIFWKIKKWFALRKSKKLEQEHVPTLEELKKDQEQFEKEGMEMKKLILKKPKISDRKLRSFPKKPLEGLTLSNIFPYTMICVAP